MKGIRTVKTQWDEQMRQSAGMKAAYDAITRADALDRACQLYEQGKLSEGRLREETGFGYVEAQRTIYNAMLAMDRAYIQYMALRGGLTHKEVHAIVRERRTT